MVFFYGGVGNRLKVYVSWVVGLNNGRNVRLYLMYKYVFGLVIFFFFYINLLFFINIFSYILGVIILGVIF